MAARSFLTASSWAAAPPQAMRTITAGTSSCGFMANLGEDAKTPSYSNRGRAGIASVFSDVNNDCRDGTEFQIPGSKFQTSSKFQIQDAALEFGIWSLSGIWSLELGISLHHPAPV